MKDIYHSVYEDLLKMSENELRELAKNEGVKRYVQDVLGLVMAIRPVWAGGSIASLKTEGSWRGDYQKYLRSEHWLGFRKFAIISAGKKCCKCGELAKVLQVHHLHYETLGRERLEDVEVLCRGCHKKAHGL